MPNHWPEMQTNVSEIWNVNIDSLPDVSGGCQCIAVRGRVGCDDLSQVNGGAVFRNGDDFDSGVEMRGLGDVHHFDLNGVRRRLVNYH